MALIESINPETGETQFEAQEESTSDEVNLSVQRARSLARTWSMTSYANRAGVLEAIANALDGASPELAELAHSETALGVDRLVGEIARTTFQLRLFADALRLGKLGEIEIDEPVAGAPPAGRPHLVRHLIGIGPVAVFGAGNFPFAFGELGGDTASALAAGCPVIVKEHPGHPVLARTVIKLSQDAIAGSGYDRDLIQGIRGLVAGQELVQHREIRAVGFTGSQLAGRSLFDLASNRPEPIPFYGELGSMNPVFITHAALAARKDQIATDAAGAISIGKGQFCTKPAVLFVPDDDEFLTLLTQGLSGIASGPLLSPSSKDRFVASVARVSSVGGVEELLSASRGEGLYDVSPGLLVTTLENFLAHAPALLQECFGPIALVVRVSQDADLASVVPALEGCLVASIQAEPALDQELVRSLMGPLSEVAGRIVLNGWPTGLAVAPAQNHGGPYPASTSPIHTSVGLHAAERFLRPLVVQNASKEAWPGLDDLWGSL
jgi:NADP-dependent aldehyde dehydrogenase